MSEKDEILNKLLVDLNKIATNNSTDKKDPHVSFWTDYASALSANDKDSIRFLKNELDSIIDSFYGVRVMHKHFADIGVEVIKFKLQAAINSYMQGFTQSADVENWRIRGIDHAICNENLELTIYLTATLTSGILEYERTIVIPKGYWEGIYIKDTGKVSILYK